MTKKEIIEASDGPRPVGPYSPAVRVGNFVYVSGQGPIDPSTGKFVTGDIQVQTRRTLENVQIILKAADLSTEDVFKVNVYLRNAKDFQSMNEVYKTFFSQKPPARTTIVTDLLFPEMLIEIDVSAHAA
jgi:2-iminobutanoate/2-iminopropanoate deaminase